LGYTRQQIPQYFSVAFYTVKIKRRLWEHRQRFATGTLKYPQKKKKHQVVKEY